MMPEWQPIESAPRDGTVVWLKDADFDAYLGRWWTKQQLEELDGNPLNFRPGWFSYEGENGEDGEEGSPVLWRSASEG